MDLFSLAKARAMVKTQTSSGTLPINQNGLANCSGYAEVDVNVPQGVFPSGTLEITQNATGVDVSGYAAVDVAVPVPDEFCIGGSLLDRSITGYHFPPNLIATNLPDALFSGCSLLERIENLPSGITSIGVNAFRGCQELELMELPSGITSIGQTAFFLCKKISFSKLPGGLTIIQQSCFDTCSSLALTELPSGLTRINGYAFYNCENLSITEFPSVLARIEDSAFCGCIRLLSLKFNGTPTFVHAKAFQNCTNLTNIYVPWAEGEVANAPWGATNATITYNYTGE